MTTTSRPIGTVIPARYRGLCRNCRHSYERGALIRKAADKVWIHDACPNGEPLPEVAVKAPPAVNGYQDIELVRGIVRDELAGATLQVDEAEVKAPIDADVTRIVEATTADLFARGWSSRRSRSSCPRAKPR